MKECSILIPNRNSFWAIQLCIESILKRTNYPYKKIIVYDDYSINDNFDLNYLRQAQSKGWIELIEGKEWGGHGKSLDVLLNEACDTELAVVMDCDVVIREEGWLSELVNYIKDEKDLGVSTLMKEYIGGLGYMSHWYWTIMFLMNMNAYKDGMQVDWRRKYPPINQEPFISMFKDYYPLKEKHPNVYKWFGEQLRPEIVFVPEAGCLYLKEMQDNPKGYKMIQPFPESVKKKFYHFQHISCISIPSSAHEEEIKTIREEKFALIKKELEELRNVS